MKKKFFENSHFFGYFAHSEVLGFFHQFLENFTSFKYQNFVILGQFLTLENMVEKFYQNSNFSDFLGIKSEISHCQKRTQVYLVFWFNPLNFPELSQIYES